MENNNARTSIKIISWNANGILQDSHEFQEFVREERPFVVLIQESRLNNRNPPFLPGFTVCNKPRNSSGGLLAFTRSNLPTTEIHTSTRFDTLSIRYCGILIHNVHATKTLTTPDLQALFQTRGKTLAFGDFNARHPSWNCFSTNTSGNRLLQFSQDHNLDLSYPTNSHTRYPYTDTRPSTIDLALHRNVIVTDICTRNVLNSDHLPVILTIQLRDPPNTKHNPKIQTNWKSFRHFLHLTTPEPNILDSTAKIDSEIFSLTSNILQAAQKASIRRPVHSIKNPITNDIRILISRENFIRRLHQSRFDPNTKREINALTSQIRAKIQAEKIRMWQSQIKAVTPKNNRVWKLAKQVKRRTSSSQIPPLHTPNSGIALSNPEKSQILAEEFHRKHLTSRDLSDQATTNLVSQKSKSFDRVQESTPTNALPQLPEILSILRKLQTKKAPGVDDVTNAQLKNLPKKTVAQLLCIIQACIQLQYFPKSWKHATVVAVPKPKKDPTIPSNYRPISLLPHISKILERVILNRIEGHLDSSNIIPSFQYGFRKGRSTTMQLHKTIHHITQSMNNRKITSFLSLDIESAFDSVWHNALIIKMIQTNFPTFLIKIVQSFLCDRTFAVRVQNAVSSTQTIPAGVPQGSVLSPTLFNIFLHDFPTHPRTKVALFADDAAIFAATGRKSLSNTLVQDHATSLEKYYHRWKIRLNVSKSQVIHFTNRPTLLNETAAKISINTIQIPEANTLKYLGFTLDTKLSFEPHLQAKKQLFVAALTSFHVLLTSALDLRSKLLLYRNGILPILTYAAPLWSNRSDTRLDLMEPLQMRALRKIFNADRSTPNFQLRRMANIPTIRERILQLAKNYFAKTTRNIPKIEKLTQENYDNPPTSTKVKKLPHHRFIKTSNPPGRPP